MSVTWYGLDEFAGDLRRFADRVADLPEQGEAGDLVAGDAAGRAPRLTGELAGSVESRTIGEHAYVFATADHAAPIIVGVPSRNIPSHPFIEAALRAREGAVLALLEQGVEREAKQI